MWLFVKLLRILNILLVFLTIHVDQIWFQLLSFGTSFDIFYGFLLEEKIGEIYYSGVPSIATFLPKMFMVHQKSSKS